MDNKDVADRLEPEGWRTTQRESRRGYEHRETVMIWGAILNAVVEYQNKHDGMSPMNHIIARMTGHSIGQIQYHVGKMEARGLISDQMDLRAGRREITLLNAGKLLTGQKVSEEKEVKDHRVEAMVSGTDGQITMLNEEETMNNETGKRGRYKVRVVAKPPAVRFKEIARAVDNHYRSYRLWPTATEIANALPDIQNGGVGRLVRMMRARGFLDNPRSSYENRLTEKGRQVLLSTGQERSLVSDMADREPVSQALPKRVLARPVDEERPVRQPVRQPEQHTVPATADLPLSSIDTLSLIVELNKRGFRVDR